MTFFSTKHRKVAVPTENKRVFFWTVPRDCDVAENIKCDVPGVKIHLVGSGPDLIAVRRLRLILLNAVNVPLVLRFEVPEGLCLPQEFLLLGYDALTYDVKPNFNFNLAMYI